jgi:TPR repeat protein
LWKAWALVGEATPYRNCVEFWRVFRETVSDRIRPVASPIAKKPVEPEPERPLPPSGTGGKSRSKQVNAFLAIVAILMVGGGVFYLVSGVMSSLRRDVIRASQPQETQPAPVPPVTPSPSATAARKAPEQVADWLAKAQRYIDAGNYAEALPLLQRAADADNATAMFILGGLYRQGQGVAQDYGKAREWYQKAAAAGNSVAMCNLGILYNNGDGVAQDYGKAREWFQKAATARNSVAMCNLGILYINGYGVAQDYRKAREWFQKAADAGDVLGMARLGFLYLNGYGVAQDYGKAREWSQKAAAARISFAMYNLGILYEKGWGVARDYRKAREWFQKADDAGEPGAKQALERLPRMAQ